MQLVEDQLQKMKQGTKTIELRLNDEKRRNIKIGDIIQFESTTTSEKIIVEVVDRFEYPNFYELYQDFNKVELGYDEDETSDPKDMYDIYSKDRVLEYGVLGIQIVYEENKQVDILS